MNNDYNQQLFDEVTSLYEKQQYDLILEKLFSYRGIENDYKLSLFLARIFNDLHEGESSDAAQAAEKVLQFFPDGENDPEWLLQMARSCYLRGRISEAYYNLKKAMELCPFENEEQAKELYEICKEEIDKSAVRYTEYQSRAVRAHIYKSYGKTEKEFHSESSLLLDLYVDFIPADKEAGRNYITLVTIGAGAYKMKLPDALDYYGISHAEYVMYLSPDSDEKAIDLAVDYLLRIAEIPCERSTWVSYSHTFLGNYPFEDKSKLCASVITQANSAEGEINHIHINDDISVIFYQVVMLYIEELQYKNLKGFKALWDLIKDDAVIVDLNRKNSCKDLLYLSDDVLLGKEIDYVSKLNIGKSCLASRKIIDEGAKIGYMRRWSTELGDSNDSGWLFMSGEETIEFFTDTSNVRACSLNTICNIDNEIVPFLTQPYNTLILRDEKGILGKVIHHSNSSDYYS